MKDASAKDILDKMLEVVGAKTDAALAHAIGVTPQSLSDARRKSKVPPAWAVTIAQNYQVSLDWLLLGRTPMRQSEDGGQEHSIPMLAPAGAPPIAYVDASKQVAVPQERFWQMVDREREMQKENSDLKAENAMLQERIAAREQMIRDMRDLALKGDAITTDVHGSAANALSTNLTND